MHASYLLPVLAAFGLATAQSTASICSQKTATIENQAEATAIASACKTFTGSIEISPKVFGGISFDGIKQITGDLTAIGAVNMTTLQANDLASLGGKLKFTSLTILSTLAFPKLTKVDAIEWTTLNNLQQLTFTAGLSQANTVFITDTALTSLDGINLAQVGNFEITNNAFLRTISTQVGNITQALTINNNGPNLKLSFPNLIWAYNMTVRNVSSFSIPSLASINTTFGVYGSYMDSIIAPNLTKVGGDVAFVADSSLTNISMPLLQTIGGGLLIANNSAILDISGFPSLKSTGAINISGNFTNAEFPALEDVKGTFNAQSSGNFSCDPFKKAKSEQVIKGLYFCLAKSNNVQASVTETSSATAASSTGSSASGESGAGMNMVSGGLVATIALLAGVLAL